MAESRFVYVTYIRTTPAKLWQALTDNEFARQYWFGISHECDWKLGSSWAMRYPEGLTTDTGEVLESIPEKKLVLKIAKQDPIPPSEHYPPMPKELERIILKALAKEPDQRWSSAAEMADVLERFQGSAPPAPRPRARASTTTCTTCVVRPYTCQNAYPSASLASFRTLTRGSIRVANCSGVGSGSATPSSGKSRTKTG